MATISGRAQPEIVGRFEREAQVAVRLKAFTTKGEHVNRYSMCHTIDLAIGLWLAASQGVARAQTATDKAVQIEEPKPEPDSAAAKPPEDTARLRPCSRTAVPG